MKPHVTLLMSTSIDGGLHPSRFTTSPDGDAGRWSALYEATHDGLAADAWIVGRVTMAEMSKAAAHPPADAGAVARPVHRARQAERYAIALDPSGRLHFDGGEVGGDAALVLLGRDVADRHLAELAGDGVSYIVAEDAEIDLAAMLATLHAQFGITRLALEGGAGINGAFLAAGLVDEMIVLVAPALDGDPGADRFVALPGGLKGKVELSLTAAEPLDGGVVRLRYAVRPGGD